MPVLSRLKSMMRSLRLWPPPRCQMVRSPELRRPLVRCFDSVRRLVRTVRRQVIVDRRRREAPRRGIRSVSFDCHVSTRFSTAPAHSALRSYRFSAYSGIFSPVLQPHVSLLPVGTIAGELAAAALFALEIRGAHRIHLHLENALHRLLDLRLGRLDRDLENQRGFRFLHAQTLFRDHRAANDLISRLHYATSACLRLGADAFSESCNFSSAGREKIALS